MIFAAKKATSNTHAVRADRREEETVSRAYVEPSPCMILPAIDLAALIRARTPRTILDYLT